MAKFLGVMKDTIDALTVRVLSVTTLAVSGAISALSLAVTNVTTTGTFKVGTGGASTTLAAIGKLTTNITPASVAADSIAEQIFPLAGVVSGDVITVSPPGITAGVAPVCARVTTDGNIGITFANVTAGALVPAAGNHRVSVIR